MDRFTHTAPDRSTHRVARQIAGALAALALALALVLQTLGAQAAPGNVFTNANPISLTAATTSTPHPAATYPSVVSVSGLTGSVVRVVVTINDLTHTHPDDIDMLLVGPQGQKIILMSDAGGSGDLSNVDLVFDDAAATAIADAPNPPGTPIASGTYKPSNYPSTDTFPTPAPAGPYGTALAAYNLTDPNGDWQLFIVHDDTGSTGSIASWSLQLDTADLSVALPANPASVDAGSPLSYTVQATNAGTGPASGASLSIPVPASTTFASITAPAGWNCTTPAVGAGGTIVCNAASFAVGSASFTVVVNVDPATALGATITTPATIASPVQEANTANNSASGSTAVTTSADLRIVSVTAPATVNSGQEMAVAVEASNAGPSNAANAVVTIPVPAGTTFVSLAAAAGWSCATPEPGAGGAAVCSAPVFGLAGASFSMAVKVDPAVAPTTAIESGAQVASETSDAVPGNNTGGASTTAQTAADMGVTATAAPNPVSANAPLTYQITVANGGPSNAASATMTTEVPDSTVFVSLSAPAGWTCTTPAVNGTGPISCANTSFGVTSAAFELVVRVKSGTPVGSTLSFQAGVGTATNDGNASNDAVTVDTGVTIAADLAATISGPSVVLPNSEFSYTIDVNNSGPEYAADLTLTTSVPENTTFVSLTAPAGWSCTTPAVGASGPVTCTNDAMDVTTDEIVLTVKAAALTEDVTVANTASISSPTSDGNPSNNSSTAETLVQARWRIFLPIASRA